MTDKCQDSVEHFNIALARGGENLNDFLFNSSSMVERTQFFLVDTLLQYFCRKILVTKPAGACQKRITTVYKLFWSDSGVHELLCDLLLLHHFARAAHLGNTRDNKIVAVTVS